MKVISAALWTVPPIALAWYLDAGPVWACVYVVAWWAALWLEVRRYCRRRGAWRD